MDFSSSSELLVYLAKWIGIISIVLIVLLSSALFVVRYFFNKRDARANAVRARWQPILMDCYDEVPAELPNLDQDDFITFIVLWNYYQETFRDAGKENLNTLALRLGIDKWSEYALKNGDIRERLLAIQTIGWLKDNGPWFEILKTMHEADPVTALCAAKALLRINPPFGIEYLMPLIAERPDLNFATIGKLLREAGAEVVTEPLIEEMGMRSGEELIRLLRYSRIAYEERTAPVLEALMKDSDDSGVLIGCLRGVTDPVNLPVVRELLKHEDWKVRTQAATCLGRIGTDEDIERLAHAAGDQDWWVRYRSALALSTLPGVTSEKLKEIAEGHQNIFGSEIITKIRQEQEVFQ